MLVRPCSFAMLQLAPPVALLAVLGAPAWHGKPVGLVLPAVAAGAAATLVGLGLLPEAAQS